MIVYMLIAVFAFMLGFALRNALKAGEPFYTEEDGTAVFLSEKMIDALNKDEPRRVHLGYKNLESNLKMCYCPRCFKELCWEDDAGEILYCPDCGQRIDWSDFTQW